MLVSHLEKIETGVWDEGSSRLPKQFRTKKMWDGGFGVLVIVVVVVVAGDVRKT